MGRQAVVGPALVELGNPLLQYVMGGDCAAAGLLGRGGKKIAKMRSPLSFSTSPPLSYIAEITACA